MQAWRRHFKGVGEGFKKKASSSSAYAPPFGYVLAIAAGPAREDNDKQNLIKMSKYLLSWL